MMPPQTKTPHANGFVIDPPDHLYTHLPVDTINLYITEAIHHQLDTDIFGSFPSRKTSSACG